MKINAVVVTYNRKDLLKECMDSLLNQTYKVDNIIVIDNNSTDGTGDYFVENEIYDIPIIKYIKMEKNLGGAGGFYEGIKIASELECDWIWIMDDDTIPNNDALEMFIKSIDVAGNNISFFASSIYGPNGEPMNVPVIQNKVTENGYSDWYMKLEHGLVKIKNATFVSLLINNEAVKKVGLPMKGYFIWGDDTEYTMRLTTYYNEAYLCGHSKALHKRYNAKNISIDGEENEGRVKMYYYYYRNTLINLKEYEGSFKVLRRIIKWEYDCIKMMLNKKIKYRFSKIVIIQKGMLAYLFKRYDYKGFRTRLKSSK